MSDIPRSPARFFGEYVPAELAGLGNEFPERSSPGAVAFEVGAEAWSLRLQGGTVRVETGIADDTLLRLSVSTDDFEPVIVGAAERLVSSGGAERQLIAARALSIDVERARMLRESGGTVALVLARGAATHRLVVSIGGSTPKPSAPDCEIECALDDLFAIQSGATNPFQLLLDGKIRIKGNAEFALALGAALG
jgi:hypothetical protein